MATFAELHRAVRAALVSKRLGQPVFVRLHVQGVAQSEPLPTLANVAAVVGEWIGQQPERIFSLNSGKQDRGQTSATLLFANGATGLVSEAHGAKQGNGVNLMLLGSKGALYHEYDAGCSHSWEEPPEALDAALGKASILEALKKGPGIVTVGKDEKDKKDDKDEAPKRQTEKPKSPYGVLLVSGSHTHQENYAAAFAADSRCKLIAVTDEKDIDAKRRQLNERLARELGIPYEADLEKALANKDVHLVSICAPPERRARIAVLCAKAGKHLYLDKALAPAPGEAEAIREAVKKAGVKSHMFSFVSQPWAAEAKRLLESGRLGTLLAIHADALFAKGRPGTATLGKPRKEEYPPKRQQLVEAKREFDNVGVYPITLIHWLTGKKFRTVLGATANYFFKEHQKHDVEDFGLLAGTLDDGLPVTIAAGRNGWQSHPAGGVNRIMLVGSERTAVIDANRPRLEAYTDEQPWTPPNVNPDDPMGFWTSTQAAVHLRPKGAWAPFGPAAKTDAAWFLDRLDAGKDSELSVVEAAHSAEVLLATYLSSSKGEVVKVAG